MKLLLIFVLLMALPASATDYFVKNGGNDASAGTSDATAWETLSQVDTGPCCSAGDSVSFKRGSEWHEGVQWTVNFSGTTGSHITVKDYDTGALPIISGAERTSAAWEWFASPAETDTYYVRVTGGGDPGIVNLTTGDQPRIFLESDRTVARARQSAAFPISTDLQWKYGNQDTLGFNTVYLRSDSGVPADHFIPQAGGDNQGIFRFSGAGNFIDFSNLILEMGMSAGLWSKSVPHATDVTLTDMEFRYNGDAGFSFSASTGTEPIALNTTVTDVWAHHNGFDGGAITGFFGDCSPDVTQKATGISVDGMLSHDNQQDGLKIFYSIGSIVKNGIFNDNTGKGINLDGTSSCNPGTGERGVGNDTARIFNNFVHDNGTTGILFEFYGTGNRIHHNLILNNCQAPCAGGVVNAGSDWLADGDSWYYNIIKSDTGGLWHALFGSAEDSSYSNEGHIIAHNTLVITAGSEIGLNFTESKDHIVRNNIVMGALDDVLVTTDSAGAEDWNYNLYDNNPSDRFRWEANFWTFAQWKTGTGFDASSTIEDIVDADFVDPTNDNYTPVTGATAVGAGNRGTLPSYIYEDGDFWHRPVPATPSIGAFEQPTGAEQRGGSFSGGSCC